MSICIVFFLQNLFRSRIAPYKQVRIASSHMSTGLSKEKLFRSSTVPYQQVRIASITYAYGIYERGVISQ